jgi:trimethylamine corrinoid protein
MENQEMNKEQILENLTRAIVEGDDDMAIENAQAALDCQLDPLEAVELGLSKGMDSIGDQFERGDVFLPELLMAAVAFKAAMEILKPELELQKKEIAKQGTVLLGTVKGDLHNIGKNIVRTVLETKGFDVVDIGIDNSSLDIIQEAQKAQADVIAVFCYRGRRTGYPGMGRRDRGRWIWKFCRSSGRIDQGIVRSKVESS